MKPRHYLLPLIATGILAISNPVSAEDTIGKLEFQKNCAACHGLDGKGNGPFLDFLKQTPSDLTLIASRNNGKFPFQRIYSFVEDPTGSRGHGDRDMPVWGERYSREEIEKYGPYDTKHPGVVESRILRLVFYLATIQQ